MIISDKNKVISKAGVKNKTKCEEGVNPKDKVIVELSYTACGSKIVTYPTEQIEKTKKQMEKAGFIFDEEGKTPAIIMSNGINKLRPAEEIVTRYGGKVTGALWLIDAFTAEITPSGYCYLCEKAPFYTASPDNTFKKLINPPATFLCGKKATASLEKLLGF